MHEVTLDVQLPKLPEGLEHPEKVAKDMLDASARAMSVALIRHFRQKNRTPNAKGWKRSNYWSQVGESVTSYVEDGAAVAQIAKEGVLLHLMGGTVQPKAGHKALAIPADPSVAGKWPSEGTSVKTFLAWIKKRDFGFIAEAGKKPLHVLWWLKRQTLHIPDPSTLPANSTLETAVKRACDQVVLQSLAGGAK